MGESVLSAIFGSAVAKTIGFLAAMVTAVAGGWFASRAGIMGAVNRRVESLLSHLEAEIKRLTEENVACQLETVGLRKEVELIRGELRQTKQTLESIERVK